MIDYTNTYSFCISNANQLLKNSIWHMEQGNEETSLKFYSDYLWYMEHARWIMKEQ